MKNLLTVWTMVLFSAAWSFAGQFESGNKEKENRGKSEEKGDHDDDAPVLSGYAVVTPVAATTSGLTTGLAVFETFGLRGNGRNGEASQAGVLPPDLTTHAMLFVDSNGRLSKNLGVAIVNPNSTNVNVTMTLRSSNGSPLGTTTVNVPSRQQKSQFVTELFSATASVPKDVTGTLSITSAGSSNMPVSVIGLRFRGSNFSTIPVTNLSGNPGPVPVMAAGVGGPGAVLLPQFTANGGWATQLVLANTGANSLTVRVDLFKQDGTALTATLNGQTASSFTNLVIPAGGVLTLAPRDKNGDDDF